MYRLNSVGSFCVLALSFVMMFPFSGSCGFINPRPMGPPPPVFSVLIPALEPGNYWVPGRVEFDFSGTSGEIAQPGLGVDGDRSRVFADIPLPPLRLNSQQLAENLAAQLNSQFVPGALRASAAEVPGGGGAWQVTFGNDGLQVTTLHISGMMSPGILLPDSYGSYTEYWLPFTMPYTVTLNQFQDDSLPEPSSIAIFGVLGLSLAAMRRRKRQNRTSHLATDK